jgi:hypothetical protein
MVETNDHKQVACRLDPMTRPTSSIIGCVVVLFGTSCSIAADFFALLLSQNKSPVKFSPQNVKALFSSGTLRKSLRVFQQDFCGWAILFSKNFERGFLLILY